MSLIGHALLRDLAFVRNRGYKHGLQAAAVAAALPSAFRLAELLTDARPAAAGGFNYQQINAGWER